MSNVLARVNLKSILIVDDLPDNLQVLYKYLTDAGYEVLLAHNCQKVLEIAITARPNLILLSTNIFGGSGLETCHLLKQNPETKNIPVVLMTELAAESKLRGFELGAVDYITTPINHPELLAKIKTHLSLQSLHRKLEKVARDKHLLWEITDCIRQSLDLNTILDTAVKEILEVLQCDRVAIARLSNENITIQSQSVADETVKKFPQQVRFDYCCNSSQQWQDYLESTVKIINSDTAKNAQAQLLLPILLDKNIPKACQFYPLWGWLIVEQFSLRQWQIEEKELCNHLIAQVAIAIKQALLYQQLQQSNTQLQIANKQLKITNDRLQKLALIDSLTKIYNRRYFDQQLNIEWRRLKRNGSSCLSLIICDVDCFKIYNDTYGHQEGDKCLQRIATALSLVLKRPADFLARYGGEEFVVALPDTPQTGAAKLAEAMRVAIKDLNIPNPKSTVDSVVTLSLGVASIVPSPQSNPNLLIEAADRALYLAKNRGRDCLSVYQQDIDNLERSQTNDVYWSQRIRKALSQNLFSLYAQPITSLDYGDGQRHFEILLRLTDRAEIVSPGAFMNIAARNSLMTSIDIWVVDNLLATLAESGQNWQNHQFSINLSGDSLNNPVFLTYLSQKIADYHLPGEIFCFEITETIAITNFTRVSNFIDSLKTLGCSFALDDFGKGMSSLSYLKNLSLDYLKIDGSFITELDRDRASKTIVEGIHYIAEGMGLKTVAEFVENQDILDTLRNLKINYAQGYHLGRPEKLDNVLS